MSEISKLIIPGNTIPYDLRDDGAVRFDSVQSLTAEQQAQVRTNIGANGSQIGQPIFYATCSTGAGTATKSVTNVANFPTTLTAGTMIMIKFTNNNTAGTPKLSVNNSTAANIKQYGSANAGTADSTSGWSAGDTVLLIYDGTYWRFNKGTNSNTTYTNLGLGQGYGTCSTPKTTSAKVVSLDGYQLVQGGIVSIKFTNSVGANATLNINSKGAKSIYYKGAALNKWNVINGGDTVTFIYDGNYYHILANDRDIDVAAALASTSSNTLYFEKSSNNIIPHTSSTTTTPTFKELCTLLTDQSKYWIYTYDSLGGTPSIYSEQLYIITDMTFDQNYTTGSITFTGFDDDTMYRIVLTPTEENGTDWNNNIFLKGTYEEISIGQKHIKTVALSGGTPNLSVAHFDDGTAELTTGDFVLITFTSQTVGFFQLTLTDTNIIYGIKTAGTERAFKANSTHLFYYDGTYLISVSEQPHNLASSGQVYVTCSTATNINAKTITVNDYYPYNNGLIIVKFDNAVLRGATLAINNWGAHAIYYHGAAIEDDVIRSGDIAIFNYTDSHYNLLVVDHATTTKHQASNSYGLSITLGGNPMTLNSSHLIYHAYINNNIVNGWIKVPSNLVSLPANVTNVVPIFNIYCSDAYPNTDLIDCPIGYMRLIVDPNGASKSYYSHLFVTAITPSDTPCITVEASEISLRGGTSAIDIELQIQFTYPYAEVKTNIK